MTASLSLVAAFLMLLSAIALGFWSRCILTKGPTMEQQLYCFHLVRLVVVPQRSDWIVSRTTIEIGSDDPFRTAQVIKGQFPGWDVDAFESIIDRDYDKLKGL